MVGTLLCFVVATFADAVSVLRAEGRLLAGQEPVGGGAGPKKKTSGREADKYKARQKVG